MSLDDMEPAVIVLHGPTSAGKSSLARALQDIAPVPAFHVALDAFVTMSRRRDMRSQEELQQAYHLHCENLRSVLMRVVESPFEVLVDLVLRDESKLQKILYVLSRRPMYLVGVQAPLDVLEERERHREDRGTGMAREQSADAAFRRNYDLVVDTSTHTPEHAAIAVRNFMGEHPRRGNPLGSAL